MRMLRRGQITITEAAMIALVSRQRVREWCLNAGIDPIKAREAALIEILQRLDRQERKPRR